jgi:hypothetical protein
MKKLIVVTILIGALVALAAGTALAAGPVTPPTQGCELGLCGSGMTRGAGIGAGGMMGRGAPEWAGDSGAVETLLGMTEEQLHAERLAGKSLAQIAASKGISEDKLISTLLDAKKANLAKLVTDGKLTQAQADLMIQNMQAQVKAMVERTNVGPAFNQAQPGTNQAWPGGMMGQGFRGGRGANR